MLLRKQERALLGPAEVARRLGVSIKALRLYERRGLVRPRRTARGWRLYNEDDIDRLGQALAFKAMGFGLSQIATLLDAGPADVAAALAVQEERLRQQRAAMEAALANLRDARRRYGAQTMLRLVA